MVIPVMFAVSALVFFLIRVLPGDVISDILGIEQTPENRAILEKQFNFDKPVIQQYVMWITGILRGDFGVSLRTGQSILPEFMLRFKVTFELTIIACVIAWISP